MLNGLLSGGGGDNKSSTNSHYRFLGDKANDFQQQGWVPSELSNERTVFRNKYTKALGNVEIPNSSSKGHIAVIATPNNGFDVVIRDEAGKEIQNLLKGANYEEMQHYFTSGQGTIAQRVDKFKPTFGMTTSLSSMPISPFNQ